MEDKFAFITRECVISLSQEEHLNNCGFVGEAHLSQLSDDTDSMGIVICSMSETEEVAPEEHLQKAKAGESDDGDRELLFARFLKVMYGESGSSSSNAEGVGADVGSSSAGPVEQQYVTVDDLIDHGDDEDDLLVIAIKAGIKFPRPSWWGAEGYGRKRFGKKKP